MNKNILLFTVLAFALAAFAQSSDIALLKSKAEAGDAAAQVALGHAYENGEGVAQNDDLAAKWYRAAADKGNAQAQSELGVMYRLGRGVPQDKQMAVSLYRMAAKQGFGPAMFNLATCYYNGDGVPISDSYAYAWFTLAKRGGSTQAAEAVTRMETELGSNKLLFAKTTLAELLETGSELPKADPTFAFEIYKGIVDAGADTRLADAKFHVARMYAEGIGVAKDSPKAITYLEASKTPQSLRYLAAMYIEGRGIPADAKKGIATLNKLVDLGEDAARRQIAGYYWDGGPVQQNYKVAVKHYGVLADQEADPFALYRLGIASRDGLGMKKNVENACFYFILGNTVGSPESGNAFRGLCQGNTAAKAKERATKWALERVGVIKASQDRQKELKVEPKAAESK